MNRELDGVHNFRALGPYRVRGGRLREGMIYRSGALELMSDVDCACLGDELGIRTILDLRHPDEVAHRPDGHALNERVLPLSIFPETVRQDDIIADLNGLYGTGPTPGRYLHYLDVGGDRLAAAFRLFAKESSYPVLVHCTAGKDRTGVLLGMLMELLGADDDDIANEYGLSDASIDRLIAYLRSTGRALEGTDDEIRARLSTPADRMAGFIQLLRARHGSTEAFLAGRGLRADEIGAIRELLTARE
ncbi:MAG TPA: tyrosine-protein phosphatase [Tepidiformaceae bacterium]|nr:tyrosine-protein phosphatase [Tepidiformaceae bacterium]